MAASQITDIINNARNFSQDSFTAAANLVSNAVTIANSFAVPNVPTFSMTTNIPTVNMPTFPGRAISSADLGNAMRPDPVDLDRPYRPTVPNFSGIQSPRRINYASLFNRQPPSFDFEDVPSDVPEVHTPLFPDRPSVDLPETPRRFELNLPDEPSVSVPGFDPDRPQAKPGEAPNAKREIEVAYNTVLPEMRDFITNELDAYIAKHSPNHRHVMQKLEERLQEMSEGGTALPEHIEQAIFDRTRRRTDAERKQREAEAYEAAARRGFTLPQGVLQQALNRSSQEGASANTTAASEVAIEMARLEQQNIQFALQTALAMRQAVLNASLQYAGTLAQVNAQAVEYARGIASAVIETYNATVTLFNAEVNYFQVQAQVYEIELRAAFAELEKFTALLRAEELKSNINRQLIDQYTAEIGAQRTKLDIYTAQLQAISTRLDVDRARIEGFQAEVQTYVARVRAKEGEIRAYVAALEGDRARIGGFQAEVEAYRAEIEAVRAQTAAEVGYSEAINSYNRAQSEVFRNEMSAYGVDVQAATSLVDSEVRAFAGQVDGYRAQIEGFRQQHQANIESARLSFEQARTQYETQAQIGIETARTFLQRVQNASQAAISGAGVYGDIAAAALSAQNTMVSLGQELIGD